MNHAKVPVDVFGDLVSPQDHLGISQHRNNLFDAKVSRAHEPFLRVDPYSAANTAEV